MPKRRLTDTLCKTLPAPAKRHQIHYDTEVVGLGLCVTAKGARSFLVRYRRKADQVERSLVLGSFPAWTVVQARQRARELRREVDLGGDPLGELEKVRGAPTLAEVIERDSEHMQRLRPSTVRTYRRQIRADIVSALGKRKIASITEQDVADLHKAICTRGATVAANRVVTTLSGILSRAIERGERPEPNPVHQFVKRKKLTRERARVRYLSRSETARLLAALDAEPDRQAANAVRLLLMTGCRTGELLASRWADFDLTEGRWHKPYATVKTDEDHAIPLSAPAVALLRAMHQHRDASSPFVFPAINKMGEHTYRARIDRPWVRIRKRAAISNLHGHDLRHAFATHLVDAGVALPVIGKLLGHKDSRSTARYAHATMRAMQAATEQAAQAITGKVVPIK